MSTNPQLFFRAAGNISHDREVMLLKRSYVARESFMANTAWGSDSMDGLKTLCNKTAMNPMRCSVVGVVTPDNLHMENHGDFTLDGEGDASSRLMKSRFHLSLRMPPSVHQAFSEDFVDALENMKDVIGVLPEPSSAVYPFIVEDIDGLMFNFTHLVFEQYTRYGETNVDCVNPIALEAYKVGEDFKKLMLPMQDDYLARNLYVWDENGVSVPSGMRNSFLANKLVQVYFIVTFDPKVGLVSEFDSVSVFSDDLKEWERLLSLD